MRARRHFLALLAYLVLSCLLTWPTILDLGGQVFTSAGGQLAYPGHDDIASHVWYFWWIDQAFRQGWNPFFTPLLYHPAGIQLTVQSFSLSHGLLTLPIQWLAGPVAAYNIGLLLAFTLTGYAIFVWARMLAATPLAAWISGVLVTAAPFHMLKLDVNHYNLVHMQWFAFCAPALLYAERRGGWRGGLPLAAALILTVLGDWYWSLSAALFVSVWALVSLMRGPARRARLGAFATAATLATLVLSPLLWQAIQVRNDVVPQLNPDLITRSYSADLLGLFAPSLRQPIWTAQAEALAKLFVRDVPLAEGWYIGAGWVLLSLAIVGLWQAGGHLWPALVAAGVGFSFGLGPVLRVLGIETGIPMPYALLSDLPIASIARRPNLFAVSTIFVAGICAAKGLDWLLARADRRRWLVLGGVGLLAALELWPIPRYGISLAAPPVYAQIVDRPGPLLDLPIGRDIEGRSMQYQITHGQPIARGYVARAADDPELAYEPILRAFTQGEALPPRDIVHLDSSQIALRQCRYRWRTMVMEEALVSATERTTALAMLEASGGAAAPWYRDATHTAYTMPDPPVLCVPYLFLGANWGRLEQSEQQQWRWLSDRADLWLINPTAEIQVRTLLLTMESLPPAGQLYLPLEVWLEGEQIGSVDVVRARRSYALSIRLPPGRVRVELRSTPHPDPTGRQISISMSTIALR